VGQDVGSSYDVGGQVPHGRNQAGYDFTLSYVMFIRSDVRKIALENGEWRMENGCFTFIFVHQYTIS
jgi:hypothetical protein